MKYGRDQIDKLMNMVRDVFDKHGIKMSIRNARLHAMYLYSRGCRVQVDGEWKDSDRNGVSIKGYMVCSACDVMIPTCDDGKYCLSRLHYCPRCGAKMSGGKDDGNKV